MSNPFTNAPSSAGRGTIHLALLPPHTPRLRTVNYQYPLKLVSPAPVRTDSELAHLIHTVYLLTYGGGLVAGDTIDLHVTLEKSTRLILLTQGSTKLFKSPGRDVISTQSMNVAVEPESALCYLPDPVQPFERSNFEQCQMYNINLPASSDLRTGNLCVLDWVSNGRPANGENWSFYHYGSRNEVYLRQIDGKRKLLLRDNLLLDDQIISGGIARRMDGMAVYGTLILYGPLFHNLGQFFMSEFKSTPRIGGRKWDSGSESCDEEEVDPRAHRRAERHRIEAADGLLWSAASVRGCIVVKFGAPVLEAGRRWLWTMLAEEGSVVTQFGERALLCLR
ncbi:related to urease accessory [Lecanosticta acicola]|uniref:Related to urease accessory n=1 Tax=Lecanosticta acicola TaxID=111012 RepID=A0AAI8Z0I3_9PEZI|nr:related to urease accessory [Lecanosticta acicola]